MRSRRGPRSSDQEARGPGGGVGPRARLSGQARERALRSGRSGAQHRLRGQRGSNFRTAAREPERRRHGLAEEHARLLRHRGEVRARRRDLRLRELELPVRHQPHDPGGVGRQHPDADPLHARARDPGRTRERIPDRQGGDQTQGRGRVPLPITTFFYPPVRKPRTTLGPPILRPRSSRPSAGRASTCSSTRPPRPTRRCPTSCSAAGASAASTACAAT